MLCPTCRLHLRRSISLLVRPSASSIPPSRALAIASTSTRRLYSTPVIDSPPSSPSSSSTPKKHAKAPARVPSIIPGGAVLKGLGYLKTKPTVHALEDNEYPDFLWGLLEATADGKDGGTGGDGAVLSAKKRKKMERKQAMLAAHTTPTIPIHKQSIDLTSPDASAMESATKREEVTKAMRDERRKGIREANFLRGM